jgi:hypothetical protein
MKKLSVVMALLALVFSLALVSCGPKKSMIKNGTTYEGQEGWINEDTLQIIALGFAPDDVTDPNQRMYQAQRAAQLNAEARVVEKLVGANVEGKTATENGVLLSEVIKKDFAGMIKGGVIVRKTFDNKTQACEITYQVSAKGLKKKAETGNWVK